MSSPIENPWSVQPLGAGVTCVRSAGECLEVIDDNDTKPTQTPIIIPDVDSSVATHVTELHNTWLRRRLDNDSDDDHETTQLILSLDEEVRDLHALINTYDQRLQNIASELRTLHSSVTYAFILGITLATIIGGLIVYLIGLL